MSVGFWLWCKLTGSWAWLDSFCDAVLFFSWSEVCMFARVWGILNDWWILVLRPSVGNIVLQRVFYRIFFCALYNGCMKKKNMRWGVLPVRDLFYLQTIFFSSGWHIASPWKSLVKLKISTSASTMQCNYIQAIKNKDMHARILSALIARRSKTLQQILTSSISMTDYPPRSLLTLLISLVISAYLNTQCIRRYNEYRNTGKKSVISQK